MATYYHEIAYNNAIALKDKIDEVGLVWNGANAYVSSNYYRLQEVTGDYHIFRTDPVVTWEALPVWLVLPYWKNHAWRQPAVMNDKLTVQWGLNNSYLMSYPDPGYSNYQEYWYGSIDDSQPLNCVGISRFLYLEEDDTVTILYLETFSQYNPLGWVERSIQELQTSTADVNFPVGVGSLNVNIVGGGCDLTGVENKLEQLHEDMGLLTAADAMGSLGKMFGSAGLANSPVFAAASPITTALTGLNTFISGLGTYLDHQFHTDLLQKVGDIHLDLDGIESHVSYLAGISQKLQGVTDDGLVPLTTAVSACQSSLDDIGQSLTLIDGRLYWVDNLGIKHDIAEDLHEIAQSGGGGGGTMEIDWDEFQARLEAVFDAELDGEIWNVSELIVALINTGWIIYK